MGAMSQLMKERAMRGLVRAASAQSPGQPSFSSVALDASTVSPCWTQVSNTSESTVSDGSTVTGYAVVGSARNAGSGLRRSSMMSPDCTTFRPTGARWVCSPEFLSTVASHMTGAGIEASSRPVAASVNVTPPSSFWRALTPGALSGSV